METMADELHMSKGSITAYLKCYHLYDQWKQLKSREYERMAEPRGKEYSMYSTSPRKMPEYEGLEELAIQGAPLSSMKEKTAMGRRRILKYLKSHHLYEQWREERKRSIQKSAQELSSTEGSYSAPRKKMRKEYLEELAMQGSTLEEISQACGVSSGTVRAYLVTRNLHHAWKVAREQKKLMTAQAHSALS